MGMNTMEWIAQAFSVSQGNYEIQQLKGSAYWVPDSTFDIMMNGIMKQLKPGRI